MLGLVAAFAAFVALGCWQIERRSWKHALIKRVAARVHAPPGDPPTRADWPAVSAARDEYRHLRLRGWLHERETLVQALTVRGPGRWVMTPLALADGSVVLVNRGFVPTRPRAARAAGDASGEVTVTGLLRLSEPGGFLRRNEPAADRWRARDVAAIGAARGLHDLAPYFVDADATAGEADDAAPVGGPTVLDFSDHHAIYAATWFALAALTAVSGLRLLREERSAAQSEAAAGDA